jgi:hypothetical protein
VSSGGPIDGKQEGGPTADRAGKGHEFPACETRKGHSGSVGAKGQWGSPHEIEISLLFRELRVFIMSNPGNSGKKSNLDDIQQTGYHLLLLSYKAGNCEKALIFIGRHSRGNNKPNNH